MKRLKTFTSRDKTRRVHILERDGLFYFEESYETLEDYTDYMDFGWVTVWVTARSSELFDGAEEAERQARATTPWLAHDEN